MSLLPRAALHSGSEHQTVNRAYDIRRVEQCIRSCMLPILTVHIPEAANNKKVDNAPDLPRC
jgi:hypothetical protein